MKYQYEIIGIDETSTHPQDPEGTIFTIRRSDGKYLKVALPFDTEGRNTDPIAESAYGLNLVSNGHIA